MFWRTNIRPVKNGLNTVAASSTGNSLQLTTNEAFTDAPDSGSAGTIQTRLSQFAYSGCTQNTVDNE